MRLISLSATGRFADVCRHGDVWLVVWHELASQMLVVQGVTDDGTGVERVEVPLAEDASAFPRVASHDDAWWLAAKDGLPGYRARLWRDGLPAWTSPRPAWGNDPVALGAWCLAWQGEDRLVTVAPLRDPGAGHVVRTGAPTGLSRVLEVGEATAVVLVDDDRTIVPGVTRPAFAADAMAGERPTTGVLVRRDDDTETVVWEGQISYTPRIAADGAGRYAVVTWSGPHGVRLALLEAADFGPPAAPAMWHVVGTEVDTLPFLVPSYAGTLRCPADGQTLQTVRTGPKEVCCVKGSPERQERWRWDDTAVYLVYDASDGRDQPWRVTPTPVWCRRVSFVGDSQVYGGTRLVRRTATGDSEAHPFPLRTSVYAYGEHIPIAGIGRCRILSTTWEPGYPASGYQERHWWAIRESDNLCLGRVRYEEWRAGVLERSFDFSELLPDVRLEPAAMLAIPDPVEPPETPDTPERPERPDTPDMPEPTIRDDEFANAGGRIEHRYATWQRPGREVHTDPLSYRWMVDYYVLRRAGRDHEAAVREVERRMDVAAGVAAPEPEPVPPVTPPTNGLVGPLRVA